MISLKILLFIKLKYFFWNSKEERFRALWRIVFQALLMILIVALPIAGLTELITFLYRRELIPFNLETFDKLMDILVGIVLTILVLITIKIAGLYIDHRKFRAYGFNLNKKWWLQYFIGFLMGGILMTFIFLFQYLFGYIKIINFFHVRFNEIPVWLAFVYPLVKGLCVGIYEEAISRGYQLTNLVEGLSDLKELKGKLSVILAVLITSSLFGILHITNPNASILSTLSLIINGVLLGTAFILTKQLGMSIGLHMSWNIFQGLIYGFPVSGDLETANIFYIMQSGTDLITGGSFGPEGGLVGILASIIGIVILFSVKNLLQSKSII